MIAVTALVAGIDPGRLAVQVVLLFPDRQPVLGFVDDVAAGLERGIAVPGRHGDDDRHLADRQRAGAMGAAGVDDVEAVQRLGQDALALGQDQLGIGLVVQAVDRRAGVVVADPALEGAVAAALDRKSVV